MTTHTCSRIALDPTPLFNLRLEYECGPVLLPHPAVERGFYRPCGQNRPRALAVGRKGGRLPCLCSAHRRCRAAEGRHRGTSDARCHRSFLGDTAAAPHEVRTSESLNWRGHRKG